MSSMFDGDSLPEGPLEAPAGVNQPDSFAGDCGVLPLDTRRVLVSLLQGPSIDGRRQTKLWPVLVRDESAIRARLHELFLDLVIDREQQVAFTRQVVAESIDAPVLLRRASLTFLDSTLLLFLRQRLTQAETQAERAVVSKQEILEHLKVYEHQDNVDHVSFERKMANALEKAKTLGMLHKLRNTEDRFEVSPTLKLLFSAEEIQALTRTYQSLNAAQTRSGDEPPPAETPGPSDEGISDEE